MKIAFDNTFLSLFLSKSSRARPNPASGAPTLYLNERIESLIDKIDNERGKVYIPAPCLAEALCYRKSGIGIIETINCSECLEIVPFDQKAAIELSAIAKSKQKEIKDIRSMYGRTWQQVKVDVQVVAIAKAYGASKLCSDDDPQSNIAALCGLEVVHTWDLPLSPARAQVHMAEGDPKQWPEQIRPTKPSALNEPPAS